MLAGEGSIQHQEGTETLMRIPVADLPDPSEAPAGAAALLYDWDTEIGIVSAWWELEKGN